MGIFDKVLLVCDMDGTLLNSEDKISQENIQAIENFIETGGLFTVATGRKETSVEAFLGQLPVNAPAILYNGSVIHDFSLGKPIWAHDLEYDVRPFLKEVMEAFPEVGVEIYKGNQIFLIRNSSYTHFHRLKENYPDIIHDVDEISLPWRKVLLAAEPDQLTLVEEYIECRYGTDNMPFKMSRSERFFLEWLALGVSKGRAIDVLRKEFEYGDYTIVTVGNETNDLEMLCLPNIGFAVANAHPEAKAVASYHCAHHDDHPIKEVIDWLKDSANLTRHYRRER